MKRLVIAILLLLTLCGCSNEENEVWRRVKYYTWMDAEPQMYIEIKDGHTLNRGHSYDEIETENGYDLVLHFVEEEDE